MSNPVVVDKRTYKVMKYLYRHEGTSLDFIRKKFGIEGFRSSIHLVGSHLACVSEDNNYSYDYNGKSATLIYLTIDGNAYVENRRSGSRRWFITTLISLMALATSIIAIVIK